MRNKTLTLVLTAVIALFLPLLASAEEATSDQNKKLRQRSKSERSEKRDRSERIRKSDKFERFEKIGKFGERGRKDQFEQRGERARIDFSSMNADQIIEAIEKRQAIVLERMKSRNEKLCERINMRSERREKMTERKSKEQSRKLSEGKRSSSEDRRKRYESFQENVQNRRAKMAEFAEKRKSYFVKQISHLEEADQQKVISAYDKLSKQFKAEMEKNAAEAQKKIKEAFKNAE